EHYMCHFDPDLVGREILYGSSLMPITGEPQKIPPLPRLNSLEWGSVGMTLFTCATCTMAQGASFRVDRVSGSHHNLTYCSGFGNTPDEALEEVLVAKDALLSAARKKKKAIPPPRYRPVLYQLKRAAGSR
ncbi:MAG: hypothetical protein M1469_04790, partial [Bacteroidetes bacterium]|nr:hypothetical protein [Bacteroidota bacterium]